VANFTQYSHIYTILILKYQRLTFTSDLASILHRLSLPAWKIGWKKRVNWCEDEKMAFLRASGEFTAILFFFGFAYMMMLVS
tara:strand:+ start:3635 stop:3880 length:246 start_codon:yes stop_codon:yes gene_type:complete